MKIKKLHHVAIAVKSIDTALNDYADVLGFTRSKVVFIESQQVKATLIPVGDAEIELIEPTDPNGGVAKFLERRGEAMHHICFEVPDVDHELTECEKIGLQLIDKKSRPGLAGMVGFLHPKSTKGVLTELCTPIHHK
ncbi:MAG: methylmalonyl-CoA epimerase [Chloroflexi bacterium]|nr:methylmalonyl-CoA epimerase [Chloroflexota bacterium]